MLYCSFWLRLIINILTKPEGRSHSHKPYTSHFPSQLCNHVISTTPDVTASLKHCLKQTTSELGMRNFSSSIALVNAGLLHFQH